MTAPRLPSVLIRTGVTSLVLPLALLLGGCAARPIPTPTPVSAPLLPVIYTRSAPDSLDRISIEAVELSLGERDALARLPPDPAPFGSRTLVIQRADTMQPPPWTTSMHVMTTRKNDVALRIEFRDHATYGVSHHWLNDHLLFLRVWWGRIVSTDIILDVDTGQIVLAEDASHTSMIIPTPDNTQCFAANRGTK